MHVTHVFDPAWWEFFDPDTPNDVILRSVLTGRCPGVAYLDRCEAPTQLVVREQGGKAFASVRASEAFLHDFADIAMDLGWTALADTGIPESVQGRGRIVGRARFEACDLESETLQLLRDQLPEDLRVEGLTRQSLDRCHHAKRVLPNCYGERLERYFDFGYGVCLVHGDDVVSEAYAGFVAGGRMEAVVGTVESFRRRGLGSIASAYLADEARERGHEFTWNCLVDNVASLKTARRLGFRIERPYQEIYYPSNT